MSVVLITGVSAGIGLALAQQYLALGYRVGGLSRHQPALQHPNFYWQQCDLRCYDEVEATFSLLKQQLGPEPLEIAFLNAGTFGASPKRAEQVSMAEFEWVMSLNVMAVKATLDALLKLEWRPQKAVASASISGQRPRAGMVSYATSKAALNALIRLYQLENPDIDFLSLGLCNVRTSVYHAITDGVTEELPELLALKQRASKPGYVIEAEQRAADIIQVLNHWPLLELTSGEFYEIRELLKRPLSGAVPA